MKDSVAKLLATVAIWAAVACIFVFGLCPMNWSGQAVILFVVVSIVLAMCAMGATAVIWRSRTNGAGPGGGT
jgi:hypothetical protein